MFQSESNASPGAHTRMIPAKLWAMRKLCLWVSVSVAISCAPLAAQEIAPATTTAERTAALAQEQPPRPAPLITRGDLVRLGAVAGLTALAYQADGALRAEIRDAPTQQNGFADALTSIGDPYGGFGALALGGAMWGGGLVAGNETVATVGLRAVEAIGVSGVLTKVIKGVAGRSRPRVAPHQRDDFHFGQGFGAGAGDGDFESFPSGHVTAAFAFASAVTSEVARRAPEHTRSVAVATYGMGFVVAYARMHADAHWFSDVTLAAGVGAVSGWAITRWHATRPDNAIDRVLLRPVIAPGPDGSMRVGLQLVTR